uniref:RNase H type-1 domain-containing protein n=1 Tax=Cannabis sativa TaxID=3483 RepID=A0A803PT84_CANSA
MVEELEPEALEQAERNFDEQAHSNAEHNAPDGDASEENTTHQMAMHPKKRSRSGLGIFSLADVSDSLQRATEFMQNKLWQDQVETLATVPTLQKSHDNNEFWRVQVDASVVGKDAGFAAVHQQVQPSDSLVSVDCATVEGVFEAELLGITCALQMAISRNIPKVWIETDSKSTALAFEARELPFGWNTFPLFNYCLVLCKSLVDVRVSFIPGQENECADALARWARITKVKNSGFLREVAPFCGH